MEIYKLSSFPDAAHGGNPAGVVLGADSLSVKEMQSIAAEVGFSETAFVLVSNKADFRVRFFTPVSEVDLCGHATIATFSLLKQMNQIQNGTYTQETFAGILQIVVEDNMIFMQQNKPIFGEYIQSEDLNKCFHNTGFIDKKHPIQVVSTAMKEIFLPIKSFETLNALEPKIMEMIKLCEKYDAIGIHTFSLEHINEYDANCRNFAPVVGINEESATGTSSGALSCYLWRHFKQKTNYVLGQGFAMGKPSKIYTKIEGQGSIIQNVWVGGYAILISEGS